MKAPIPPLRYPWTQVRLKDGLWPVVVPVRKAVHNGRRHATVARDGVALDDEARTVRELRTKLKQSERRCRKLQRDNAAMVAQGERVGINLQPEPRRGRPPNNPKA